MRNVFIVILLLICSLYAFSQENRIAAGLGPEFDMNSRHNFAGGAILSFDINLTSRLALGATFGGSTNFTTVKVMEPAALFRFYFLENPSGKLFGQVDAGIFLLYEDGYDVYPMALVGVRAGMRKYLGSLFYIEPFGRLGYPYAFGLGVMAGIRL